MNSEDPTVLRIRPFLTGAFLIGASLLSAAVAAQGFNRPVRTEFGVYVGGSSATIHGDSVPGPTHLPGFVIGASAQVGAGRRVSLQPELQFVQKGDNEVDEFGGSAFTTRIRLSYVEVPVLLRVTGDAMGPRLRPFVVAGPAIAFKVGCGVTVTGLPGNYTCSDLPPAESVDFGAIVGGGVDFPLFRRRHTLQVRYDLGLVNAFKNNDAKNRALTVVFGAPLHR